MDVPLPELAGLVLSTPAIDRDPDPALALARPLGVGRLVASSRARLEDAIGYAHRIPAGAVTTDRIARGHARGVFDVVRSLCRPHT
jgi:hypothetical protein